MKEGFQVEVIPELNLGCSISVNQARGILPMSNLYKSRGAWRARCVINALQLRSVMGAY